MIIKDKLLNFTKNKTKRTINDKIKYLIIHHTGGYSPSDFNLLSGRSKSGVSIHYYIGKDGLIWHLVDEKDYIAWHTGSSDIGPYEKTRWGWNLNPVSIGIELSNLGNGIDKYTEKQIKALKELSIYLVKKYNIKSENILGHKEITRRKIDPSSNFFKGDMEGFREYVKNYIEENKQEEKCKEIKRKYDELKKLLEKYKLIVEKTYIGLIDGIEKIEGTRK